MGVYETIRDPDPPPNNPPGRFGQAAGKILDVVEVALADALTRAAAAAEWETVRALADELGKRRQYLAYSLASRASEPSDDDANVVSIAAVRTKSDAG
ncbi:MAG: hypothetical protein AAGA56_02420 [Myxococcota bacterium]